MNPPPSPGVGQRRKGPKTLPRLPLSAFSPPNSGTSERFPLPPSPSTVHPESIVDAHVLLTGTDATLADWKKEAGEALGGRVGGLVVALPDGQPDKLVAELKDSGLPIVSLMLPFSLESAQHEPLPSTSFPTSLYTTYSKTSPEAIASLNWALSQGKPVDIDVLAALPETAFEGLEELLSRAVVDVPSVPPIVVSSFLPPPHDLTLSIVKLMKHPSYQEFQAQAAALSLYPTLHVKFLPPVWDAPTPATPVDGATPSEGSKAQNEWKRRIKMYLGPVIEAFGYERIIFGSSPSPTSKSASAAGDWYEIARESLAELGVEQEVIDDVFAKTARKIYGASA
ncbi:hypothetical protein MIND_00072700 [Mycena indigotica]|uniref:Aldolase n=1 Tax=Mycena indigotica TaxID=2126181 RepID=A0A8H6TE20_9AGAR|nr:uncharacterized protein MIND_00072700 [Mycena indigotica]KAF7315574.1 hypothetical protein MIND_00072700 [Mycena indigotica]